MDQIVNVSSSLINATLGTAAWTLKPILKVIEKGTGGSSGGHQQQQLILKETIYSLPLDMRKWTIIGGIMGASAVALGAYGAHVVYPRKEIPDNRKAVFETANKYHFLHSLVLLSGVPAARRSNISGTLFLAGTILFSGSCYYNALTDNKNVAKYAPLGGVILIIAWLSLAA